MIGNVCDRDLNEKEGENVKVLAFTVRCHGVVGCEIWDLYASRNGQRVDARSMRRGIILGNRRRGWTYLAGKWDKVVFAKAVDGDFPDQDHLVMIFGEDGIVDNV